MMIYAHRGARGYTPENTMAAFQKALELKADGIELDVQMTKDGELVICHDHTIDRTSNGSGWIRDFTLQELKQFDFGSWFGESFVGIKIATFIEFFTWYVKTPLHLNVEIKNGPAIYEGIEEKLVHIMKTIAPKEFDLYGRLNISSFYHPSLCKIKELDNHFKTGVLFSCYPVDVLSFIKQTNADYLHSHWHYLDAKWIKIANDAGIGVNSYTVNTLEEFNFVKKLNIQGIFSDYPDCWSKR